MWDRVGLGQWLSPMALVFREGVVIPEGLRAIDSLGGPAAGLLQCEFVSWGPGHVPKGGATQKMSTQGGSISARSTSGARARWEVFCACAVHAAAKEELGSCVGLAGGPRSECHRARVKTNWVAWPHLGHGGQPGSVRSSGRIDWVLPSSTALPECSWTRIRLALAAGWQKP